MADSPSNESSGADFLAARVLGSGVRAGQRLAGATGVDQALDAAAEEAIVGAVESPAFERALIRLAEDGRLQAVLERAAGKADVVDLVDRALDSDASDQIWEQLLASDKAQKLVERIAEAPEVRAAIAQQGFGLISDIGRQVRRITQPVDGGLERVARALFRRPRRTTPTDRAGLMTRLLAGGIDVALMIGALTIFNGLMAAIVPFAFGTQDGLGPIALTVVILFEATVAGSVVVSFWALAGQTPGMRFLGIRLDVDGSRRIGGRRAFNRLLALPLAIVPFGLGYFAMLLSDHRRGLHDALAGTEVVYEDESVLAPWAVLGDDREPDRGAGAAPAG